MPAAKFVARWLLPLAVTLLATGVRFYRLDAQSYWNDEGNSLRLAERGVSAILTSAAADIHPPGYYLLLKAWHTLLGSTEFGLRSFSALAGVVLVAVVYQLGQRWFSPCTGTLAALLAASHPFLIDYSQEARMYALLATLSAASFWLFDLYQHRPTTKRLTAYGLTTALGLYTHYAFGFVLLAQGAIGLLQIARRPTSITNDQLPMTNDQSLLIQFATPLLLFLPWLPTAYHQLTRWPAAREFPALSQAGWDLGRYLLFGRTLAPEAAGGGLGAAGVLLMAALILPGQRLPPALWLFIPAGLTLAFGLLSETFSKFLLVAVPPLCVLLAAAWRAPMSAQARPSAWHNPWQVLRLGLYYAVLTLTAQSLNNLYFNPAYARDDYRGIAQYFAAIQRPGDAVITIAPNQWEVFTYYHDPAQGAAPIFPLPQTRPLEVAATETALTDLAAQYERVFVLYWGDQQADPDHVVEHWLNAHTFKAAETWYGRVRMATYAAATPAASPAALSGARFGEHITLVGYALRPAPLAPGDILQLTLFWQTDAPLAARYKVFLHLYADPNAPPVAQNDSEPGGGQALTSSWQPGQTYPDHRGLLIPADLVQGDYKIAVGLYNLFDGTRLRVTLDPKIDDRLFVDTVRIR
jgi:hypothetical protein